MVLEGIKVKGDIEVRKVERATFGWERNRKKREREETDLCGTESLVKMG